MCDRPKRIRAVLFDLDDTIYDHSYASRKALEQTIGLDSALTAAGIDFVEAQNHYWLERLHHDVAQGSRSLEDARNERWMRLLEHFQGNVENASRLASFHRNTYLKHERAVPGAFDMLDTLRNAGLALAIVSNNSRAEQLGKLERLGVLRMFSAIIVSADHGFSKPDPRLFQQALNRLDVSASEAVHVGDNWNADIEGAINASIHPIWFNRFEAAAKRDGIDEICELKQVVTRVFSALRDTNRALKTDIWST
jgi:HAD superfamily hydrolase (TIGR01549 family)